MKSLMGTGCVVVLLSVFAGCAMESGDPAESTTSADVTEHATNFVVSCAHLALRTCDNPGACDTGIRMPFGTRLDIDTVDWNDKMAHVTSSPFGSGWALADLNGESYISVDASGPCH